MNGDEFHIFSIVEGDGEITALPKLLHRICRSPDCPFILRTDKNPYKVDQGVFFNNSRRRKMAFHWVARMVREYGNGGVLILMDAEISCCQDLLNSEKIQKIRTDIDTILEDIPHLFVLAEKGYESWLVAGLGGTDKEQNDPSRWLTDNRDKSGLLGTYKKVIDQHKLTSSDRFDIDRATMGNTSFRRLRERILTMAQTTSDTHS